MVTPVCLEYHPSPSLAPYVECFWSLELTLPGDATSSHRVLPDGCIDILFDLAPPPAASSAEPGFVIGAMTRPILVWSRGQRRLVAVRFRPGGAFPFFGLAIGELTDGRAELGALWTGEALSARLREAQGVPEALRHLEAALLGRLPAARSLEGPLRHALSALCARPHAAAIEELSREIGWSRQHLTRRFTTCVGLGPKQLARVLRLRRLLRRVPSAGASSALDWATLAAEAGYYDQAHLIGEFRALVGLTPGQWARERFQISKPEGAP